MDWQDCVSHMRCLETIDLRTQSIRAQDWIDQMSIGQSITSVKSDDRAAAYALPYA
jgi:hypothetical protein